MRPANAQAHAALAANLAAWPGARRGELLEALAHGRRAVALDGELALAHAALGVAQARLGRVEPGAASLRNALRLDPTLEFARSALAGLGTN
jgi:ribosomal protein S12 methylthiotransferase accessory factor